MVVWLGSYKLLREKFKAIRSNSFFVAAIATEPAEFTLETSQEMVSEQKRGREGVDFCYVL